MAKNVKGSKRTPEEVAKMIVSQLETGYGQMLARHTRELDRQAQKIKAAKARLEVLQANKKKQEV